MIDLEDALMDIELERFDKEDEVIQQTEAWFLCEGKYEDDSR